MSPSEKENMDDSLVFSRQRSAGGDLHILHCARDSGLSRQRDSESNPGRGQVPDPRHHRQLPPIFDPDCCHCTDSSDHQLVCQVSFDLLLH